MPSMPAEPMPSIGGSTDQPVRPYRVLARTYRPQRLSELIGQDALVRTLTNALHSGRVAHAFLLTGIRGVGKTTTARIIARALNCVGPDGSGQPTPEPCGQCEPCVAIAEGRHIDVLEMDAATRTGIDDIREIVDSVRYAPSSARTKVYIIDEVHMLSEKAFNGLLKTLEEPPPQTIFIFATTEVRKVPVTVLSRCQRFDLRRVEGELLQRHLGEIAAKEGVQIEPGALALIVRAAEGSVRDGLSLLDQAIALAGERGDRGGAGTGDARARRSLARARPVRACGARRDQGCPGLPRRAVCARHRARGGAAGSARDQPLADPDQAGARGGGRLGGGAAGRGARPGSGRSARHAGARARLADAAEGPRGRAARAERAAGGGDGAGPLGLRRRAAATGRAGQKPRRRVRRARVWPPAPRPA